MESPKKYYAFISYKREDERWAKWIQNKLESYRIPVEMRQKNPSLPQSLRPVFRDVTDLNGLTLLSSIAEALDESRYLIVICSPLSSKSVWVNKEVQYFIDAGREKFIIPVIVDGVPFSEYSSLECLPEIIRVLPDERELLCVNVQESGRESALVKVISRMTNISYDVLWQRYRREQQRITNIKIATLSFLVFVAFVVSLMFYRKNREIDRQNWQLMEIQSTVVGELAHQLAESGDCFMASMLALEMLPRNLEDPERPYSPQADMALRAASVTRGGMFKGHDLEINGAIVARNLDFLITASSDMSIKMWDMCTGACLNTLLGHEYPVGHIELNQDETLLVSDDNGGIIKVWDMSTLECLSTIDTGNLRWVDTSFDASGKKLRCFADRTLKTYDPITGECVSSVFFPQMKSYDDFVWVCGNYLMTTTIFARRYDLWDIETQQMVKTYKDVRRMSIGLDKKFVEVIDDEGVLSVYSLDSGQCELVFQVDDFNYSLSPDFEKIALAVDGVAYIIDLRSGGIVSQFEISGVDADIIWTHDVKSIITIPSGAAYAEINDIEKESQTKVVSNSYGNGMHVRLSPNEEMLAYAIEDTLRIVSLNSGDAVLEIINDDLTYAKFDFSPDNEYFIRASHSSSLDRTDSRQEYVNIYDITDASTVRTIEMECQAESFAFSHDGRLLAVGTRAPLDVIYLEEIDREIIRQPTGECYIYMIDLSTGTLLSRLDGHHGAVTSLQFSSDDKTLVSSSNDRSIVIWDVRTYSKVQVLEGHNDVVRNVFLIEDDTRAVSSSWDGTIRVWDIDSGACEQIVRAHGQHIIDVVVADDLSYFATLALDYTKVWSLEKMECVSTFGHIDDLSFVPDGNYVLTSRYGDVSMSHLSSGVCVDVFEGVGSEFDYSSSSSVVASAGKNGVLLFRIEPLQELIDRMQDLYKHRQFTSEERIEYNLVGR